MTIDLMSYSPFLDGKEKTICQENLSVDQIILIPRGCAPFGQHQESQPLAKCDVFLAYTENSFRTLRQSDLSNLTLSMRIPNRSMAYEDKNVYQMSLRWM